MNYIVKNLNYKHLKPITLRYLLIIKKIIGQNKFKNVPSSFRIFQRKFFL